jgi:IclR family transcriptional regulator, pca regulon regulatory protein
MAREGRENASAHLPRTRPRENAAVRGTGLAAPEPRDGEFVEGLARGLSILESFDRTHAAMTLSEVARRTGVSPAAARRSLHTLVRLGYVRQLERRFVLSARMLALASAYLRAAGADELLLPELRRLVGRFGDASSVAVLDGTEVLYVAHHSEQRARRIMASVGITYPAHATSLGKVLLACLSPDRVSAYVAAANFRPLTDRTITDGKALAAALDEFRARGYATSVDELDYGVTSIAVPIRRADGQVVAAVNSSGYSGRITAEALVDERLEELRLASLRIGQMLDAHPALAQSFPV